jgi:signal transduction histidine kinase
MRRINSISIKTGTAILIFSILVTILFSGILLLFQQSAEKELDANISGFNIYPLSNEDLLAIFSENNSIPIQTERIVNTVEYQNEYTARLFLHLLPYAFLFCIFLFISSFFLWAALRKIHHRSTKQLVQKLNTIGECDDFIDGHSALTEAYKDIKGMYNEHFNDNKRLYAYLSHEQKNALAIFRTKLELDGHIEYLSDLDDISDSIDNILTLSEVSEDMAKGAVDVSLICAAVCDKYNKVTDTIAFEFDENDNTEIYAKERWIYRAIGSLLSNAVKYGEGKPITVTVKNKHNSVIVMVKDNGIGIPLDKQEEIFNHRYRINELNKDGYGIGLSLASHVCDLCGGFAMVESKLQEGAAFYLSFPALTYEY